MTAAIAVRRSSGKAAVLLCADIVYACAFVWDRLLPNYEPILGGWFQEWGSVSLIAATGAVLGYDVAMEENTFPPSAAASALAFPPF